MLAQQEASCDNEWWLSQRLTSQIAENKWQGCAQSQYHPFTPKLREQILREGRNILIARCWGGQGWNYLLDMTGSMNLWIHNSCSRLYKIKPLNIFNMNGRGDCGSAFYMKRYWQLMITRDRTVGFLHGYGLSHFAYIPMDDPTYVPIWESLNEFGEL